MFSHGKQISFSLALIFGLMSGIGSADDTDIYVGDVSLAEGVIFPNILFILDTSGSMNNDDDTEKTRLERMKDALRQIISSSNNVNMGMMRFHKNGGPVLFPVSNIHAAVSDIEADGELGLELNIALSSAADDAEEGASGIVTLNRATLTLINKPDDASSGTLSIDVSDSKDDAEERVSDGDVDRYSGDLEFMKDGDALQIIGLRFRDLEMPLGSVVSSARIEFQLDEDDGADEPVTINIFGQRNSDPGYFSSTDYDISGRDKTLASVAWSPEKGLEVPDPFETPDLSPLLQEIMALEGWASGNAMAFIFEHVGGAGTRIAESKNGSKAPRLSVQYSSGSGAEDQHVGLRFQKVMAPQGATITAARLEFEAAQTHSSEANLLIKAQAVDDAPAFSASSGDISSRSSTTAGVDWDGVAAWEAGVRYQSPDLTAVVQEVVNREGWCGGSAMAFIISGDADSRRVAKSFEGDTTAAPRLILSYDEDSVSDDACINQLFQARVMTSLDDVEEASDGAIDTDSSDLDLKDNTVGVRFRNVTIPKDRMILNAELIFTADEEDDESTSLMIEGEAVDDSEVFSTASANVSSRNKTSASVSWNPPAWRTAGETHRSPDLTAIVQELVNRPGWQSGNAMSFIITGSGERAAESYDGEEASAPMLRVQVRGRLGTGYQTVRERLLEIVDGLNYKSGTPILDTLYEAARYYRGEGVHYGKTRGQGDTLNSSVSTDRSQYTRLSHPASYTGGTISRPEGCTAEAPNSTDCVDEAITGAATYITPVTQWCQANYQILLSDGNGYGTQSVSLVNDILQTGYSCSNNHDQCSIELTEFLHQEDQNTSLDSDQTVSTYTIGFNLESTSPDFLQDVANAGGGSFYTADSAAELATAFQTILADILSRGTSFTAPAVSVNAFNKLFHDDDMYFSFFLPERTVRWSGNLKKYKICAGNDGDTCTRGDILDASSPPKVAIGANSMFDPASKSYWSLSADGGEVLEGGAASNLPGYTSRTIYTYTASADPANTNLGVAEHTISTSDAENEADDALRVLLGAGGMSDDDYGDLIYWMLGKDVKDEDDDGSSTDDRWAFADPLHSQPLIVTYGKEAGGDPIKKIFIGTNDGMLRMINSDTGVEEWSFVPQALLDRQKQFYDNVSGDHLYGMDGDITAWIDDVDEDGEIEPATDKVWLFAGMRRGGRNIYAFDVTPGSTLSSADATGGVTPKLKWRIQGGASTGFGALGQTWSAPQVARIPYGGGAKDVLLFGGGYDSAQDTGFGSGSIGNAVYAVDMATGALVWSAGASGSGATVELTGMDYPIPSDLSLMDANGDRLIDRIYVGDMGGQLWRLDLQASGSSVAVSGARLAVVSDTAEDAADADKRKFFYPPDVAQVYDSDFSTVPEYDLLFITSGNRADPTDTVVQDRAYAIRDYTISGQIAADFTPLTPASDLYDANANLVQQGTEDEQEAATTALKGKKGWYFDLKEDAEWVGEKGLSSPIILDNRVFFTTYVPGANDSDNDVCGSPVEGYGKLYAVDIFNGSAVYPNWDGSGDDANFTKEDRDYDLWAGIPSGVVPVFQPKGVMLVVGGGGGGGTFDPDIQLPVVRTFWMQER